METKQIEEDKGDTTEQVTDVTKQETLPRRNSIELQKLEPKTSVTIEDNNAPEKPARQTFQRPEVIYAPERTRNWMSCLKFGLIAFNILIWLLGAVILAVGIWVKVDPNFWNNQLNLDITQFQAGAYVAIALGVIILLIGLIGCCGAFKGNVCCLALYLTIALIILCLEIAAMGIVWSAVNNESMTRNVEEVMKKAIRDSKQDEEVTRFLNLLQHQLQCCGAKSYKDYEDYQLTFPPGCYDETNNTYQTGCVTKIVEYLKDKAAILGGIAVATLLVQIAAIVCTICLICTIRQGTKAVF